jgi:hypothetical protein
MRIATYYQISVIKVQEWHFDGSDLALRILFE